MDVGGAGDESYRRVTFFYGYPHVSDRAKSWQLLDHLHDNSDGPWVCIGDFNEILKADEQEGGNLHRDRQMEGFRNAIERCQLIDLGYGGKKFT